MTKEHMSDEDRFEGLSPVTGADAKGSRKKLEVCCAIRGHEKCKPNNDYASAVARAVKEASAMSDRTMTKLTVDELSARVHDTLDGSLLL